MRPLFRFEFQLSAFPISAFVFAPLPPHPISAFQFFSVSAFSSRPPHKDPHKIHKIGSCPFFRLQKSHNQYIAHQKSREILWIIHKILWGVGGGGATPHPISAFSFPNFCFCPSPLKAHPDLRRCAYGRINIIATEVLFVNFGADT
jgi:hypothetical protein